MHMGVLLISQEKFRSWRQQQEKGKAVFGHSHLIIFMKIICHVVFHTW